MARHAQPREIAELKGAVAKDPQRYRNTVPKSKLPLGPAPEHLSDAAAECWHEISFYSLPGVLTGADRFVFELASDLLAEYRFIKQMDFEERIIGKIKFPASQMTHLRGLLASMGLSPSARTKLGVDESNDDDPYDRLDD